MNDLITSDSVTDYRNLIFMHVLLICVHDSNVIFIHDNNGSKSEVSINCTDCQEFRMKVLIRHPRSSNLSDTSLHFKI